MHQKKAYSKVSSLEARVALKASIQVLGYRKVWEKVFVKFGVDLNDNLASVVDKMNKD